MITTSDEILKQQVTCIKTATGYDNNEWGKGEPTAMIVPLHSVIYDLPVLLKDRLIEVEQMEYHSKEQREAKDLIPRYYICGVFDLDEYNQNKFPIHGVPLKQTNLMTIDIDEKDNSNIDIWKLREEIFNLPYVFSCLKSISGHGYYCIIPIKDTLYTKEYYNYILRLWKQKYNINIDDNANTLVRSRILSWNDDIDKWVKKGNIDIWELQYKVTDKQIEPNKQQTYSKYEQTNDSGLDWSFITNKAMELLIDNGYHATNYKMWYHLGCELKNFPNGYDMFCRASTNNDYNDPINKINKKWNECEPTGITEDLIKKWCGMARNQFGEKWFVKYINPKSTKYHR